MIVLHIDTQEDTHVLTSLYDGLSNTKVFVNPTRDEIESVLSGNRTETLMCCGHGSQFGLFGFMDEYIIDGKNVDLLKGRDVIGIWCYASLFAEKHKLRGFFTYMFISNPTECGWYNMNDGEDYDFCNMQNVKFSQQVNVFVKNSVPLNEWVDKFVHDDFDFVNYNYAHLSYFDGNGGGNNIEFVINENNKT